MAKINVVEVVAQDQSRFERILAKCSGALGEILVEDALIALGYTVNPTNNNARQRDIVVTSPKGTQFRVEVKAGRARRPVWPIAVCPDLKGSEIWCLVSAPRKPNALPDRNDVEIYVLTCTEAEALWRASPSSQKNPKNGDIRRSQVSNDALAAWHKLPG